MSNIAKIRSSALQADVVVLPTNTISTVETVQTKISVGAQGLPGATFSPTVATRYTNFVGDGVAEIEISETSSPLQLVPNSRTVERGLASWWNSTTSRIMPETLGDAFRFRLSIFAKIKTPTTVPFLIVEFNNATDIQTPRIIASSKQPVTGGGFEDISFECEAYTGGNLLTNGGKVTLRTFGGNVVIKDPRLLVKEG